jgi:hypothetical protein
MNLRLSSSCMPLARIVSITFLLLGFQSMNAQTAKGTISLGLHNFSPSGINIDGVPVNLFGSGSMLGVSWGKSSFHRNGEQVSDPQTQYTFGLNFSAHYFPVNKFSVGAVGSFFSGFSAYPDEATEEGRYAARILLVGPEVRYYFGTGRTKMWTKASGSLGALNIWWDGNKNKPTHLSKLAAGTGVSFFVSKAISVDVGLEYNVFTMKLPNDINGVNTNLAFDVGFGLFFGRGNKH